MTREIDRILAVPRRPSVVTDDRVSALSSLHGRTRGARLLPAQAALIDAVADIATEMPTGPSGSCGVLALVGCGGGKTLALQIASKYTARPLLVLPRTLVDQMHRDRERWRTVFRLPKTVQEYPPTNEETDMVYTTYGKLSHPSAQHLLLRYRPTCILFDEFHLLGSGARFSRVWDYIARYPTCMVVGATGSLTNRSVLDYHLPAALALRDRSPLPLHRDIIPQWASVLDAAGEPSADDRAAVEPLVRWANATNAREAFRERLRTTPGVVTMDGTIEADTALSMRIRNPRYVITPEARMAGDALQRDWVLPDGTELVDALEVHRHRRTLRLGFYYAWDVGVEAEFAGWFAARRSWAAASRAAVQYGGYDSRYFVETAAREGRLIGHGRAWAAWDAIRDDGPPARTARWVDEGWSIQRILQEWGAHKPGSVVWYRSRAVADWVRDHDPGLALHTAVDGPPTGGPAIASLAYGKGWNGQAYHRALVLEPPDGARNMEQLLARHHRRGQTEDVEFTFIADYRELSRWRSDAEYATETTGAPQRVLVGNWMTGGSDDDG